MAVHCRHCGTALGEDAKFCRGCGKGTDCADTGAQASAPPRQANDGKKSGSRYLIIGAVIVVALVLAVGGFFGLSRTTSDTSQVDDSDAADATPEESSAPVVPAADVEEASSQEESFLLLEDEYEELAELDAQARAFATDEFNKKFFSPDVSVRQELVVDAQSLLDEILDARDALLSMEVEPAYERQKESLASLSSYLVNRAVAMRDAAEVAVDNPSTESGNGTVKAMLTSRRNHENKLAFEQEYPNAKPFKVDSAEAETRQSQQGPSNEEIFIGFGMWSDVTIFEDARIVWKGQDAAGGWWAVVDSINDGVGDSYSTLGYWDGASGTWTLFAGAPDMFIQADSSVPDEIIQALESERFLVRVVN